MIGVYDNPERARQLIRFNGMTVGRKCFTDFDAVMEYDNRAWLVFEVKAMGKAMPTGQRLAIERFVTDVSKVGKIVTAAVVEHDVSDPTKDILLSECIVRSVYEGHERKWRRPRHVMTARQLMSKFVGYVESL